MTTISTHHCICSQLLLATTPSSLQDLPTRQSDKSTILPLAASEAALTRDTNLLLPDAVKIDDEALMLELDDGFEKRFLVRCRRCGVAVGYFLDWSAWEGAGQGGGGEKGRRGDVVFLLEGAVVGTGDVKSLEVREGPEGRREVAIGGS